MDEKEKENLSSEEEVTYHKERGKREVIRTLKFIIISASAGLIQTLTFSLFKEVFKTPYFVSYLTALVLSVLWNFTINRKFTFKSASNVPKAMALVFLFYLVFTPLSIWWGEALAKSNVNEYLILVGTMIINLVLEFLYSKFVVYKNSIDTNKSGQKDEQKSLDKAKGKVEK